MGGWKDAWEETPSIPKVQEMGRSIICLLQLQQLSILSGHVKISKISAVLELGYFNPDGLPELIPSLHE